MSGSGLVAITVLVLAYATISGRLAGSIVTAPMVFVAGGILVSADVLGWLDAGDRERARCAGWPRPR